MVSNRKYVRYPSRRDHISGRLDQVQTAFSLCKARPASRSRVLARPDRACAMGAADAGKVLVVKRVIGLGKKEFGVDCEQAKCRLDAPGHVDQCHALSTECRRDGHIAPKFIKSPAQDLLRTPLLCRCLNVLDLLDHAIGSSSRAMSS